MWYNNECRSHCCRIKVQEKYVVSAIRTRWRRGYEPRHHTGVQQLSKQVGGLVTGVQYLHKSGISSETLALETKTNGNLFSFTPVYLGVGSQEQRAVRLNERLLDVHQHPGVQQTWTTRKQTFKHTQTHHKTLSLYWALNTYLCCCLLYICVYMVVCGYR